MCTPSSTGPRGGARPSADSMAPRLAGHMGRTADAGEPVAGPRRPPPPPLLLPVPAEAPNCSHLTTLWPARGAWCGPAMGGAVWRGLAGPGARSGAALGAAGAALGGEGGHPRLELVEPRVQQLHVAPGRDGEPGQRPLDGEVDQLLEVGA